MKPKTYYIVEINGQNPARFGGNPSYICRVSGIQFYSASRKYAALFTDERAAQKLAGALEQLPWCLSAEVVEYNTTPLGDVIE